MCYIFLLENGSTFPDSLAALADFLTNLNLHVLQSLGSYRKPIDSVNSHQSK